MKKKLASLEVQSPVQKLKSVLVTGGAGYIGSHVVRELVRSGYRVVVLDNLSKGHRAAVDGVEVIVGDLSDRKLLSNLFQKREITAVLHFAARSLVGESMREPAAYYRNNVLAGLSLLDTMVAAGVPYLVFSSTAAVYGEPKKIPIPEGHTGLPTNPYGASKHALEEAIRWYGEAYGLNYAVLRYFNAAGADLEGDIGEDHNPETHIIPMVLKVALGLYSRISVFGNDYPTPDGTCIRDYVHVSDLAAAHVLALKTLACGAQSSMYNLGSERGHSVLEVIRMAEIVSGKRIQVEYAARRPGDPAILVASSEKARQELGWRPRFTGLADIIKTAWRWHSSHPEGYGKE
ncbi:MAG: UDP-glucose 4-epimerase GalE [Desulfotomaculaceae bacterium]